MNKNVVCIGAGCISEPTMTVIAQKNPSRKVYVVDISKAKLFGCGNASWPWLQGV